MTSAFLDVLGADGPSADRVNKMDPYGRFVSQVRVIFLTDRLSSRS